ncbi:MAG: hypothetical protein QXR48_01480 [Candidatus Woesearchaeota archaeon]
MQLGKKTWMSIFISAIMILSVIGFALTFTAPEHRVEYNGMKFSRTQQGWQAKINNIKLQFTYHPLELEDISLDEGAKATLDTRVMWFSYSPEDIYAREVADALFYMEEKLNNADKIYVQRALLNNTGYVLPEVTCTNATTAVPVFILQSGNETIIKHENGCIIATAEDGRDIYRIADKMLYQALGVTR